ncbi:MAG: ATP synthase F1 subunit epsilon [Solirubrobacteraceae bacterium]|nr:ATP synthase F1 subunit epsilon [Solirubrobacteraceae bacterium]
MARTTFPVEVLTPEGSVFSSEVEMVSTRTETGSVGILANHQPLLGLLQPTELRLYTGENAYERLAQGEGYVQVAEGRVLLLLEEAFKPEELDVADLREKLGKAEAALANAQLGTEEFTRAARDKRRWEAFIAVAEDSTVGH